MKFEWCSGTVSEIQPPLSSSLQFPGSYEVRRKSQFPQVISNALVLSRNAPISRRPKLNLPKKCQIFGKILAKVFRWFVNHLKNQSIIDTIAFFKNKMSLKFLFHGALQFVSHFRISAFGETLTKLEIYERFLKDRYNIGLQ